MDDLIAELDIEATKADTLRFSVDFFEDAAKTIEFNLAQFADYTMQIKTQASINQNVIQLTLADGLAIAGTNTMNFEVEKDVMDVKEFDYVYDLEGNNNPGDRRTILKGLFKVQQDVTRVII